MINMTDALESYSCCPECLYRSAETVFSKEIHRAEGCEDVELHIGQTIEVCSPARLPHTISKNFLSTLNPYVSACAKVVLT